MCLPVVDQGIVEAVETDSVVDVRAQFQSSQPLNENQMEFK